MHPIAVVDLDVIVRRKSAIEHTTDFIGIIAALRKHPSVLYVVVADVEHKTCKTLLVPVGENNLSAVLDGGCFLVPLGDNLAHANESGKHAGG